MKLRILSDLHLEWNGEYPFTVDKNEDFYLICGDISSSYEESCNWLKQNIINGVFVEGNHIGYNSEHSIQYLEKLYAQTFPLTNSFSYLKNTYKIVKDIVFVGGILWTDFELFGNELRQRFLRETKNKDFRVNYCNQNHLEEENWHNFQQLKETQRIALFTPRDAINFFIQTTKTIDEVCRKFPEKKVVVLTHHAPSIRSVPEKYRQDINTLIFASNLENFILHHKNIVLWCHGHIHEAADYKIGNCRVICNPRGYVCDNEKTYFDKDMNIEI